MMQPGMTPAERTSAPSADLVPQVTAELIARLGPQRYQLWCDGKIGLAIEAERLTISVGSPFLLNWMQKQFRQLMSEAAQAVLGPAALVVFEVDARLSLKEKSPPPTVQTELALEPLDENGVLLKPAIKSDAPGTAAVVRQPQTAGPKPGRTRKLADLNEFVPGQANQLALAGAWKLVGGDTASFNPLYIHGAVGIGKTHLLEGICRELRKDSSRQNIVLLTAEAFANYFTLALRDHALPAFRQKFRTAEVLLVDDVNFFEGKRVIQEEFLHTVADLMDHGRPVVMTGDRHPRLLTKLSQELTTRIVSGMVCRVEPPDDDARRRIIQAKSQRSARPLSADVLDYVAKRFSANVRELEGALNCLTTYAEMLQTSVTVAAAREILCDLERDCLKIIRLADIEQAVCALFGLTGRELKSESRSRTVSRPRMLAMYLARKHTSTPYSEIGQHFGGRDHSTVISAERKVREWIESNAALNVAAANWSVHDVLGQLEQQLLAG